MNPDISALLQKAKDSLAAAELLRREGYWDFSASRAYYAMFYVAEALLASLGLSFSSHAAVQAAYGREFAKAARLNPKYHRWLIDAQDFRHAGDYGVGASISEEQAGQQNNWAREFIQAAEEYLVKTE